MKTKKFLLITLSVLFISIVYSRTKDEPEVTKEYHKNFAVNEQTTMEIHNKYGKITVKNWAKNEVQIDVTVKVTGNKVKEAQKYFDQIHIIFKDSTNWIYAKTDIDKIKDVNFKFFYIETSGKGGFEINYEIHAPVYLKLNLHNKYGDIFLNEVHGYSQIFLKYGNLSAKNLFFPSEKPVSTINISYGNADVINGKRLTFNVKYSNVSVQNCLALIAISKYSNFKLQKVLAANCDSKYDTYKINRIGILKFTGKYETLKIDTLTKKLDLELSYGSLSVQHLLPSVIGVKTETEYAGVKINVSKEMNFSFDASISYGDYSFPENCEVSVKVNDYTSSKVSGWCGDKNAGSYFQFESQYGDVKIRNFD